MRVMAEAVEARARVYISAHENRSWENRDKLRRRHAAQLQDHSSCNWLAPRTGPRCAGVLWASLMLAARSVQSSSSLLKAGLHCIFYVLGDLGVMLAAWKTRFDIVQHTSARAVPAAGLVDTIDSRHREPCWRPESASNWRRETCSQAGPSSPPGLPWDRTWGPRAWCTDWAVWA